MPRFPQYSVVAFAQAARSAVRGGTVNRDDLLPLMDKLRELSESLDPEDARYMLGAIAGITMTIAARMSAREEAKSDTPVLASEDQLLTVDEAAAMLGVKRRWLYDHAATLPFTHRLSRKSIRFSRRGIERWLSRRRAASSAA